MKKNRSGCPPKEINAFLGEGTVFKGLLSFEGTVRIDGKVEGEIITKDTLIVGDKADIKAEIKVGSIIVNGCVYGNIVATERIEIYSSGRVYGDIQTPVLVISEGVIFNGKCQMSAPGEDKSFVEKGKKINHTLQKQLSIDVTKKKDLNLEEMKV